MAQPKGATGKSLRNAVLLKLRRFHLYSGLFLLPWAALYGVTAILFNHSTWGTEARVHELGPAAEAPWPEPQGYARRVVAAIASSQGVTCEPDLASAEWHAAVARVESGDLTGRGIAYPDGRVRVQLRPRREETKSPFRERLSLPGRDELVRAREQAIAARLDAESVLGSADTKLQRGPTLAFRATDAEGRAWRLAYDVTRRRLSARPAESQLGVRDYLLRLHLSHGYPAQPSARLAWAIGVDAMGCALLFWCVTGLLMWGQMTRLRRGGAICLIVSAAVAIPLAWAMHAALS